MFSSTKPGPVCPSLAATLCSRPTCTAESATFGTDLPGLVATLSRDPEAADEALRERIARAQALAAGPGGTTTAAG